MGIEKLYQDYNVPYSTPAESHNTSKGWIGLNCPFCDDPSDHLGANLHDGRHFCWRCGAHKPDIAVATVLGVGKQEARALLRQYGLKNRQHGEPEETPRPTQLAYPSDTGMMGTRHRQYLASRGFDPDYLANEWHLMGTGPSAKLDSINLANRILIPIYWRGRPVSWQTRAITDRGGILRYKGCPKEREIVAHGNILYGKPGASWGYTGIMVEGVTDVWAIGRHAFATFGTGMSHHQLVEAARHFRRVVIAFDPEITAQNMAKEVAKKLRSYYVEAVCVQPHKEPGEMAPQEARGFVHGLGLDPDEAREYV